MSSRVFDSAILSQLVHSGITRKWSNVPYFTHPQRVFDMVANKPVKDYNLWLTMCCAALLHDTVEDGLEQFPDITNRIAMTAGRETLNIVLELTNPQKNPLLPIEERERIKKLSRKERKCIDREHISKASDSAKIIKLFDRLDNLRDLNTCPDEAFIRMYKQESKSLLEVLRGVPGTEQEILAIESLIGA